MAGAEQPLRARDMVEGEAEESGAEGGSGDEDEHEDDDGRDLEGFIAPEGEADKDDAAGECGSSSESDEAAIGDEELLEDDLAVLQEAGVDISQVQLERKKRDPEASAAEPPKQRRRVGEEGGDGAADDFGDLFGDEGEQRRPEAQPAQQGGLAAALRAAAPDDLFGGMSDDDIDDFIVEDPAAIKRRRRADAGNLDIDDEQLQEIIDIFGDTSVLRPIDEAMVEQTREQQLPIKQPEGVLVAAEKSQEVAMVSKGIAEEPLDPDLLAKLYKTKRDLELETKDVPERWVAMYMKEPELLDRDGVRRWTDDEHECEAKWIYQQVLWERDWDSSGKDKMLKLARDILDKLHKEKLEPIVIVTQFECHLAKYLYRDDIWRICNLDQYHWPRLWLQFQRLKGWQEQLQNVREELPKHLKDMMDPKVFDEKDAEIKIKDAYDWFCTMHSVEGANRTQTSDTKRIQALQSYKFDEKLGVKSGLEQMTLRVLSMTPEELGENIENKKQVKKPDWNAEDNHSLQQVLEEHTNETFRTAAAVEETLTLYLAKLIACEPRVRNYVREQFRDMCAVSTFPTEAGKGVAQEAAQSFKRSYRAFHLVCRRTAAFEKDDDLFLDVLNLQRQGLVNLEYSLVERDKDARNRAGYKYVMLGRDTDDVATKDKQRLAEHFKKMEKEGKNYLPGNNKGDVAKWSWCKEMQTRLEAVARSIEVDSRRRSLLQADALEKASLLFKCAKMTFGHDHLNTFMVHDPILEQLLNMYCKVEDRSATEVFVVPNEWNAFRKRVIIRTLRNELYPLLWAEVKASLARAAEDAVCAACIAKLTKIVDMQPWKPTITGESEIDRDVDIDDERALMRDGDDGLDKREHAGRKLGYNSAIVVVPELGQDTCVVAFVNKFGDPIDMRELFTQFHRPKRDEVAFDPLNVSHLKDRKYLEHRNTFMDLLRYNSPDVVLLPILSQEAMMMKQHIKEIIDEVDREKQRPFKVRPEVLLCDPTVARMLAYHPSLLEDAVYRDCEKVSQKVAISLVRYMQDPLAETCKLWHERPEENGLFKLRLHRLQNAVPNERLGRALMVPLMETLAKCGVHVNRLRHSTHLISTVSFLPGFGPRKARLFQRCLVGGPVTSREALASRIAQHLQGRRDGDDPLQSPILRNCIPFVQLRPDHRDTWEIDRVPGLDRTRVSDTHAQWALAVCKQALRRSGHSDIERDLDAGDPIARAMKLFERLERDPVQRKDFIKRLVDGWAWDEDRWDWRTAAGEMGEDFGDKEKILDFYADEIADPFSDKREPYEGVTDAAAFSLAVVDAAESYNTGKLVHAVVQVDKEYPDEKARPGEKKATVIVKVLPGMVRGSFFKQYREGSGKGYIRGCNTKFLKDETIVARIVATSAGQDRGPFVSLSVDMDTALFVKNFPISEEDATAYVPFDTENWVKTPLGRVGGVTGEEKKLRELKKWVRRPRNIRHPNWTDRDHEGAVAAMQFYPLGNVLFRPSKKHDVIIAMLKVWATDVDDEHVDPKDCFRPFDILEHDNKTESSGFELAQTLEVDMVLYKDFDEVIARHMDPIMDNLRLLREHPRYGLRNGDITDKDEVWAALFRFSKEDRKLLHYALLANKKAVGHGLLLWALGGQKPREEFIEVHPQGFSLWGKPFDKLNNLIKWFKTVGWRNATRMRKDFIEAWERRRKEAEERRGADAFIDRPKRAVASTWHVTQTTLSGGLQTPGGGGLATPSGGLTYGFESAAPTPSGLATPSGGFRTPAMAASPGSPAPQTSYGYGGTSTPRSINPMSPAPNVYMGGTSTPRGFAPGTPRAFGASVPGTPMGLGASRSTRAVPSTPMGLAPGTPRGLGGFAPFTPSGLLAAPGSAPPGTPGGMTPQGRLGSFTPATGMPATPRGMPATPAGLPPPTPAGRPVPASPGGIQGASGLRQMPRTPAGPPPPTPGGAQPRTPVGLRAFNPAG